MKVAHLPILTFHAIETGDSPLAFPPELFTALLRLATAHGYRTISLGELRACLDSGEGFPVRTLVLTFDDGYRSVFDEAYPRLRDHGFSATLFLTPGRHPVGDSRRRFPSLCGRGMVNWDEVAELANAGWEIGAHTLSHPDLSRIPVAEAIHEMSESKRLIEQRLDRPVTAFAYPYGRRSPSARPWLAEEFHCACGVSLALVARNSDPFALERIDMYYLRSRLLLPLLFSPRLAQYLFLRRIPRRLRALLTERLVG
jgi:peptidoglycan/xylan/chitin deacetylase (PgdA/CDA1 family)